MLPKSCETPHVRNLNFMVTLLLIPGPALFRFRRCRPFVPGPVQLILYTTRPLPQNPARQRFLQAVPFATVLQSLFPGSESCCCVRVLAAQHGPAGHSGMNPVASRARLISQTILSHGFFRGSERSAD